MNNARDDRYFYYLMDLGGGEEHSILYRLLYDIEFYSSIETDYNRAKDGLVLRDEWAWDTTEECPKEGPCSVLEMLIALGRRYLFVSGQPDLLRDVVHLFLENLGLLEHSDREFRTDSEKDIYKKVYKFLDRKYTKKGVGGLFPIRRYDGKDMRNEEIWYQMNYYLIEKYDEKVVKK